MRLTALIFLATFSWGSEFPLIFSSAGDEVYANMQKYQQIKGLDIYQDRPELLEAFCIDANQTMQMGFTLDKTKDDAELAIDKEMIKSYAKELRVLSKRNAVIQEQLEKEIQTLYTQGEFTALKKISDAGFVLNKKIMRAVEENRKKEKLTVNKEAAAAANSTSVQTQMLTKAAPVAVPVPSPAKSAEEEPSIEKISAAPVSAVAAPAEMIRPAAIPVPPAAKKKPTELEYYNRSLASLKEELYALRENTEVGSAEIVPEVSSPNETKTACLNDITAINYWMIRVIENSNDSCMLRDAIKQMKAYGKASMESCGRESIRYVEWHGRIKPYVGKKLFEAEAGCSN